MESVSNICIMCGTLHEESLSYPSYCKICKDDRQYVNPQGQTWTTLQDINCKHQNSFKIVEEGIYELTTFPIFAIGQTAYLIKTEYGNLLWDCLSNIDNNTITKINELGGLHAIAISHPHFFTTMTKWSKAFNNAPIFIQEKDKKWVSIKYANIIYWKDSILNIWDGLQLIHCGGHFPGSCVALLKREKSILFCGDTIQIGPDLKSVSFMYSYPNLIPLNKKAIIQIQQVIKEIDFDKIFGAFGRKINNEAKGIVDFSIKRYLEIFD